MNMIKTLKLTVLFLICSLVATGQLTEWEGNIVEEAINASRYVTYTNNKDIFNDVNEAVFYTTLLHKAIEGASKGSIFKVEVNQTWAKLNETDWERIRTGFFIDYIRSEMFTSEATPIKTLRSLLELKNYGQSETEEGEVYTEIEALLKYWLYKYIDEIEMEFIAYAFVKAKEFDNDGKISIHEEISRYLNSALHKFAKQKGIATVEL